MEEPIPYPRVDWFDPSHLNEDELEESGSEGKHQEEVTKPKEG